MNATARRHTAKAVVVDDDHLVSLTLTRALNRAGYAVEHCAGVSAAVAKLRFDIDVAVLDWNLVGDTSEPLLEHIVSRGLPCGVILISGTHAPESTHAMLRFRGDAFVPKPFRKQALVELCDAAARLAQERRRELGPDRLLTVQSSRGPRPALDRREAFYAAVDGMVAQWGALTPRVRQAVHLAARGLSQKQAAQAMGISYSTYRSHMKSAREALGLESMEELLRFVADHLAGHDGENGHSDD